MSPSALLRILLQAAPQTPDAARGGHVGRQPRPSPAPAASDRRERVGDVLARERPPARQHLEQHARRTPRCRRACRRSCPRACSGAMYAAVPRIIPACVIAGVVIVGDIDTLGDDRARGLHRLRQAEVEHLHRAVGADLDVRGLQIAMDDALLVRGFERLGDLLRDRQRFVDRESRRARSAATDPRPRPAPSRARARRPPLRGRRCARCSDDSATARTCASRSNRARRSAIARERVRQDLDRDVAIRASCRARDRPRPCRLRRSAAMTSYGPRRDPSRDRHFFSPTVQGRAPDRCSSIFARSKRCLPVEHDRDGNHRAGRRLAY